MIHSTISFKKMHGAGNDFVVIDNREYALTLTEIISLCPKICDRRFGVGADGILILNRSNRADYEMIYRNADGSDAGMCGNGARCLARFAVERGFPEAHTFHVHEHIYKAVVQAREVSVHFPVQSHLIQGDGYYMLHTGTEHVVQVVPEEILYDDEAVIQRARAIRYDETKHPSGTNVNFLCSSQSDPIQIVTYERGVEHITLACGTGALASAGVWHALYNTKTGHFTYEVGSRGGVLGVSFYYNKETHLFDQFILKGPALFVFDGQFPFGTP